MNNGLLFWLYSIYDLPDKTVIKARAKIAPVKTISREWRIAMIAAIKNVLSPSSETMITEIDAANAWMKPTLSWPPVRRWPYGSLLITSSWS